VSEQNALKALCDANTVNEEATASTSGASTWIVNTSKVGTPVATIADLEPPT
jgi:hypothetical protein